MKFHTAMGRFLRGFCLPGEASKIDIMENIADCYCAGHPIFF